MRKSIISIAGSLLIVFLLYAAAGLLIPLPYGNKPIEFEVKKGTTFRQAVENLTQKGLVRDKVPFLLFGRLAGIDRKVKAGYYPLWGSMTPLRIFNALRTGEIIEYEITIVPGDSLMEIAEKFSALGIIDIKGFNKLCSNRNFLDGLEVDAPSLEGYIFPETYKFPKGLDAEEVLSLTVEKLRKKYNAGMLERTREMKLTERDVLTMASIIEKEAIVDEERPVIAAVYYNRLRRNIPLQADPTAIYGIKSSKERITKKDLMRKTKYNTYVIKGLPPGPISSPGLKSINAALNPAEVPYLYFVSNNDGTHNFSTTLSSHLNAVKAYRDKKNE